MMEHNGTRTLANAGKVWPPDPVMDHLLTSLPAEIPALMCRFGRAAAELGSRPAMPDRLRAPQGIHDTMARRRRTARAQEPAWVRVEEDLVEWFWMRLEGVLADPVQEHAWRGGVRVVQVLGLLVLVIQPNGYIRALHWSGEANGEYQLLELPGHEVTLVDLPRNMNWLSAAVLPLKQAVSGLANAAGLNETAENAAALISVLVAAIKDHLAGSAWMRNARQRIAKALALNPEVLQTARRTYTLHRPAQARGITVSVYNQARYLLPKLEMLGTDREQLSPILALAVFHGGELQLTDSPLVDLCTAVYEGPGPVGWDLLLSHGRRLLLPLFDFYGAVDYDCAKDLIELHVLIGGKEEPIPATLLHLLLQVHAQPGRKRWSYVTIFRRKTRFWRHLVQLFRDHDPKTLNLSDWTLVIQWVADSPWGDWHIADGDPDWPWLVDAARHAREDSQRPKKGRPNHAAPVWHKPIEHESVRLVFLRDDWEVYDEGTSMGHNFGRGNLYVTADHRLLARVFIGQEHVASAVWEVFENKWRLFESPRRLGIFRWLDLSDRINLMTDLITEPRWLPGRAVHTSRRNAPIEAPSHLSHAWWCDVLSDAIPPSLTEFADFQGLRISSLFDYPGDRLCIDFQRPLEWENDV